MSVVRSVKDRANPYVQINKKALDDPLISLKAKGFIAYCLSKPDSWVFYVEQLCKVLKEKEKSIYNVIQECIKHGYAIRWRKRHSSGVFEPWETVISDSKEEIERIKNELNKNGAIKDDLPIELKKCSPHRPFPRVDYPRVEKEGLVINDSSNNDISKIIIAPTPTADKTPKEMPAGGNNNSYECVEKCEDLSPKQKSQLGKYPEETVIKAVRYTYHPNTKLKGPAARIKQLHHFCQNPELYEEAFKNLDIPKDKKTLKQQILEKFKKGERYNGYEFIPDDIGPCFLYSNGVHAFGLKWKESGFEEKWIQLLKKLGIKNTE